MPMNKEEKSADIYHWIIGILTLDYATPPRARQRKKNMIISAGGRFSAALRKIWVREKTSLAV
jgi:hypothetical protein